MSLKKLAANLGEKNIPKNLVQAGAPTQLMSLYWREEASSPPKTTVEIWMLADNTFMVVSGDFNSGEWSQDHLTYYDVQPTLDKAMYFTKQTFAFAPIAEEEVAKEEVDQQTPATEETQEVPVDGEERVANKVKRLIRKN